MRFLAEWFNLATSPIPWLYKGVKALSDGPIKAMILSVLSIAGFTVSAIIWNEYLPIPWWAMVLAILVLVYLGLTAGLAWERSRGASVELGPVVFDSSTNTFLLRITNGKTPASIEVQINNILDSCGNRFLYSSIFLVAQSSNPNVHLREEEERHYTFCKTAKTPQGNPSLMVADPNGVNPLVVSDDVSIHEQREVKFNFILRIGESTSVVNSNLIS